MVDEPAISEPFLDVATHVLADQPINDRPYVLAVRDLWDMTDSSSSENSILLRGDSSTCRKRSSLLFAIRFSSIA